MKEEKNHVGRPTNEEVKVRKKKKLVKVFVPMSLVLVAIIVAGVLLNFPFNNLKGSIYTTNSAKKYGITKTDISTSYKSKKTLGITSVDYCTIYQIFDSFGSEVQHAELKLTYYDKDSGNKVTTDEISANKNSGDDSIRFFQEYYGNNEDPSKYRIKPNTTATLSIITSSENPGSTDFSTITHQIKFNKKCGKTVSTSIKYNTNNINKYSKSKTPEISCPSTFNTNQKVKCTLKNSAYVVAYNDGSANRDIKIYNSKNNEISNFYGRLDLLNNYKLASVPKDNVIYLQNYISNNVFIYAVNSVGKVSKTKEIKWSADKTGLKLNCPESVKVNQEFTCTTNAKGVKISVSKTNLAKGYNTSFKTTANDKTKQSKYTKTGTVTVKAELSGYKSVEKKVKIVSSSVAKNSTLNGKCSAKLSAIGNYKMQYTTSCTGNAKVTNIAYQVINPSNNTAITKLINRGSGWGAYKAGTSTIGFASDRKGKKIRVRVYYDTNASSKSTSHYQDAYEILK